MLRCRARGGWSLGSSEGPFPRNVATRIAYHLASAKHTWQTSVAPLPPVPLPPCPPPLVRCFVLKDDSSLVIRPLMAAQPANRASDARKSTVWCLHQTQEALARVTRLPAYLHLVGSLSGDKTCYSSWHDRAVRHLLETTCTQSL